MAVEGCVASDVSIDADCVEASDAGGSTRVWNTVVVEVRVSWRQPHDVSRSADEEATCYCLVGTDTDRCQEHRRSVTWSQSSTPRQDLDCALDDRVGGWCGGLC